MTFPPKGRRRGWQVALALVAVAVLAAPTPGVAAQAANPVTARVRLPFPQDDGSLTPYTFELGYPLVTLIYDTVMWRDEQGIPRPWLARSVETSADGGQVTIKLIDGVRWQDGAPLTSADVAFTFAYVAGHPNPRFTPEVEAVARVEAPDPSTAVVHLRHPAPGFTDQPLADLPILPAHIWQTLPRGEVAPPGLPVGSGPYRLVEHQAALGYRFEANLDYFRGAPAVRSIEVPIVSGREETVRAFEVGAVDVIPETLDVEGAARVTALGTRVITGPSYLGTVLMFNTRRPPFDRLDVREAAAEALDLDAMARLVGNATPADDGYLHPGSPWSGHEILHRYAADDAERRFAALGVGPITLLAPDDEPSRLAAARQAARALTRVGLDVTVEGMTAPDLSRAVGADGSAPTFQAAIWSTPALASYDPSVLSRLFGSPESGVSSLNYTGYANPAFDTLARRVSTDATTRTRSADVDSALRLLSTDVPVVPLFFTNGTYAFRPAVYDGWVFVHGSGILDKLSFVQPKRHPLPAAAAPGAPARRSGLRFAYVLTALLSVGLVIGVVVGRSRR